MDKIVECAVVRGEVVGIVEGLGGWDFIIGGGLGIIEGERFVLVIGVDLFGIVGK